MVTSGGFSVTQLASDPGAAFQGPSNLGQVTWHLHASASSSVKGRCDIPRAPGLLRISV